MSALPPKADKQQRSRNVRFVPEADLRTAAKQSLFEVRHALGWSPPATCGHCANVTVVAGGKGHQRRHGAGQARAGYLVRSIKVSTACITEVCGLRKQ